ncbi:MAG: hypothetical protein H7287_13420, partial [Thermoleophilia bacterium]|nr:hypothetical protein [Thermoleophilia bacterium]
ALYRWLAKQPGASVRHGVVDEVGRHGDEVTFEHIRDVPVPTFRVTARELIGEFAGKGLPKYDLSKIDLDKVYVVDDLRQTRRWRVSFILDLESGALLQRYMYLQQREVGDQPRFITWATGPRVDVGDFGGGSGSALAQVFLSRERTSSIEPTLAVCKPHPEVCR